MIIGIILIVVLAGIIFVDNEKIHTENERLLQKNDILKRENKELLNILNDVNKKNGYAGLEK